MSQTRAEGQRADDRHDRDRQTREAARDRDRSRSRTAFERETRSGTPPGATAPHAANAASAAGFMRARRSRRNVRRAAVAVETPTTKTSVRSAPSPTTTMSIARPGAGSTFRAKPTGIQRRTSNSGGDSRARPPPDRSRSPDRGRARRDRVFIPTAVRVASSRDSTETCHARICPSTINPASTVSRPRIPSDTSFGRTSALDRTGASRLVSRQPRVRVRPCGPGLAMRRGTHPVEASRRDNPFGRRLRPPGARTQA